MKKHGMTGKKNAVKESTLGTALPRVRCTQEYKDAALARSKQWNLSWSAYIRKLIELDRDK